MRNYIHYCPKSSHMTKILRWMLCYKQAHAQNPHSCRVAYKTQNFTLIMKF